MRDKIRRKFVCVKIIKIKNIPKKEREATKVEVELLKRLNHPNIVRYIDSFLSRNNESLCIAMEYCDGGDLASQIKAARKKLFSEDKILHWFVQIALGVHYMHTKSVLHRDLKTQNIFLLGNGRLVLGDLGISKVRSYPRHNRFFLTVCLSFVIPCRCWKEPWTLPRPASAPLTTCPLRSSRTSLIATSQMSGPWDACCMK